jgi:hypothetical protein
MLSNQAVAALEPQDSARERTRGPVDRATIAGEVLAFVGMFGLTLLYALRGGAYDIVVFEEYGLVIWGVLAIGITVGILPRVRPAGLVLLLCGALAAYAAWTALSLIWTQSSELTTEEIARSLDYLGLVLLLGLVLGRDTWRAGALGLGFGALSVCVIAVASRIGPAAFPINIIGITFKTDRLSYPFGYWNAVSAWGAMSTAIGLAWSAHDRNRLRRALALALVPGAALATYLSYSRAGVVGTALAVAVVFALSRNRLTVLAHAAVAAVGAAVTILAVRGAPQIAHGTGGRGGGTVALVLVGATLLAFSATWITRALDTDGWRAPRGVARGITVACAVVVLVVGAFVGPKLIRSGWHSFTRPVQVGSTSDPSSRLLSLSGSRYVVWKSALAAFDAHPGDGTGAGTFEFWFNRHSGGDTEFVRDAHNLWLENMAELGLPGLLLIIAVAIAAVAVALSVRRKARRSTSAGISAAFLAAFVVYLFHASVDWMWESTAVTVLALAGVAALGGRLSQRAPALRWWMRAVLVALCVGASVLQLPGLVSTSEIRSSQAAERSGNGNLALSWANDAVDAEPWSASAHEQRGLVLEAAHRYRAAAVSLRQAVVDEPTNYVHWLDLARVEAERGKIDAALGDYTRARQLRPSSVAFAPTTTAARR